MEELMWDSIEVKGYWHSCPEVDDNYRVVNLLPGIAIYWKLGEADIVFSWLFWMIEIEIKEGEE